MRSTPESLPIVAQHQSILLWNDDVYSLFYDKFNVLHRAIREPEESDNNPSLAQKRYKLDHNWYNRFASLFWESVAICINRPSILLSITEKSSAERYTVIMQKKERPRRVVDKIKIPVVIQDIMVNTVFIQRATPALIPKS